MTTWAIDDNAWGGDQTNWNTAPIVGFQDTDWASDSGTWASDSTIWDYNVLSMASSVATSAVHRLVGAVTVSTATTVTSETSHTMPTGTSLSATPSVATSASHAMTEAPTIAGTPAVTGSSAMAAIGVATVEGEADMTPVANGIYSVAAAVEYGVTLPLSVRLFWEKEADSTTSWTEKSDDTKP